MTTQPGKGIKQYRNPEADLVRNPYNYDAEQLSHDTGLECKDESLTQQQYLEETDINYIANRFLKTGELPQVPQMPTAGDFTGIFDFQSAMNLIKRAKDEFATLPAKIRSRFDNNPAKLIDFLDDPANKDEAIVLGLIDKQENDNGRTGNESTPRRTEDQTGNQRAPSAENAPEANKTT